MARRARSSRQKVTTVTLSVSGSNATPQGALTTHRKKDATGLLGLGTDCKDMRLASRSCCLSGTADGQFGTRFGLGVAGVRGRGRWSGTMGEEDSSKRCPTCQRVPLILFSLTDGSFEHARVGCLCHSVVLERLSMETPWTVATAK